MCHVFFAIAMDVHVLRTRASPGRVCRPTRCAPRPKTLALAQEIQVEQSDVKQILAELEGVKLDCENIIKYYDFVIVRPVSRPTCFMSTHSANAPCPRGSRQPGPLRGAGTGLCFGNETPLSTQKATYCPRTADGYRW